MQTGKNQKNVLFEMMMSSNLYHGFNMNLKAQWTKGGSIAVHYGIGKYAVLFLHAYLHKKS